MTIESGSDAYFSTKPYTKKYRGVGYIQMTWNYSYKAFATFLALQAYPELAKYATFKSPNNNGSPAIDNQYANLINGATALGINIKEFTDIYDIGSEYVSTNFAWECAGYDWATKGLNNIVDSGGSSDDVSKKINRYDTATFPKRKAFYDDLIKNQCMLK